MNGAVDVKLSSFQTLGGHRMGTHPSGPAVLAREPSLTLRDWLKQSPAALGPAASRFDGDLPFLFKV